MIERGSENEAADSNTGLTSAEIDELGDYVAKYATKGEKPTGKDQERIEELLGRTSSEAQDKMRRESEILHGLVMAYERSMAEKNPKYVFEAITTFVETAEAAVVMDVFVACIAAVSALRPKRNPE